MPLARLHAPFDHPDWIFEPKLDGFRALAYVENGAARLVSRKQNVYRSFPALTAAIGKSLPVRGAIVDGEIVHLGPDGAPLFYDLMRRRAPQHFVRSTCCGSTAATSANYRSLTASGSCAALSPRSRRQFCASIILPATASIYTALVVMSARSDLSRYSMHGQDITAQLRRTGRQGSFAV